MLGFTLRGRQHIKYLSSLLFPSSVKSMECVLLQTLTGDASMKNNLLKGQQIKRKCSLWNVSVTVKPIIHIPLAVDLNRKINPKRFNKEPSFNPVYTLTLQGLERPRDYVTWSTSSLILLFFLVLYLISNGMKTVVKISATYTTKRSELESSRSVLLEWRSDCGIRISVSNPDTKEGWR